MAGTELWASKTPTPSSLIFTRTLERFGTFQPRFKNYNNNKKINTLTFLLQIWKKYILQLLFPKCNTRTLRQHLRHTLKQAAQLWWKSISLNHVRLNSVPCRAKATGGKAALHTNVEGSLNKTSNSKKALKAAALGHINSHELLFLIPWLSCQACVKGNINGVNGRLQFKYDCRSSFTILVPNCSQGTFGWEICAALKRFLFVDLHCPTTKMVAL